VCWRFHVLLRCAARAMCPATRQRLTARTPALRPTPQDDAVADARAQPPTGAAAWALDVGPSFAAALLGARARRRIFEGDAPPLAWARGGVAGVTLAVSAGRGPPRIAAGLCSEAGSTDCRGDAELTEWLRRAVGRLRPRDINTTLLCETVASTMGKPARDIAQVSASSLAEMPDTELRLRRGSRTGADDDDGGRVGTAPIAEDVCAICLERPRRPIELRCGHRFCGRCARAWFRRGDTCPTCRVVVRPWRHAARNILQHPAFIFGGMALQTMVYTIQLGHSLRLSGLVRDPFLAQWTAVLLMLVTMLLVFIQMHFLDQRPQR